MKHLIAVLSCALVVAPSFCHGGAGSDERQISRTSSTTQALRAKPARHKHVTQTPAALDGYCRDSYCARAKISPWFPAAPGD